MTNDRQSLYRVLLGRFIIITVILIVNTALFGLGRVPVFFLAALIYVLTIVYSVLLLADMHGAWLRHGQIFCDLVIATLLVHYTGSVDSVLILLYPLISIAAALLISPRAALVAAFAGAALHAGMVSAVYLQLVPWLDEGMRARAHESSYVFSLLYLRVTVFSIIGVMAAYLVEQSSRTSSMVGRLQESLRREDRLRAIGRLAASTAHEIRNPLASISGCVEALQSSIPHDGQSERLFSLILKETARLNNIITGLLEFGKPRAIQLCPAAPAELVDEVITLLRGGKEIPADITIQNFALQTRVHVPCDPEQIKQVLFNLLKNSLEAMNGRGRITVQEQANMVDKRYELSIRDTGAGMDASRLAKLFQPFSSGKTHGVGLGLAIAQSIMQEHGGTIDVESREGEGSLFRLILPLVAARTTKRERGIG